MRWALHKIDSLFGTIVAAIAGLLASQMLAFINAYLQRLGGHLDEARQGVLNDQVASAINDEALRAQIAVLTQARVDRLESAYRAIEQAGVFARPFVFFRHVDQDIALATAQAFHPALPIDLQSLIFGGAGIVLGWVLWELTKAPFLLYRRRASSEPPAPH
ncbi:MAG: DUF2937 family protein [Alphaproteobacteria bacterium]|nr:DUF2937 family protein [Alphaproteobacteria bacterium]